MNKEELLITKERISKYKRKLAWHTNRLMMNIDRWGDENSDELDDEELSIIKERILKHQKAISEYEKRLAWNIKRLGVKR